MSSSEYRQILKTSVVTGVSKAFSIGAIFVRNKLIAVYAGPAGLGLLNLLSSTTGLINTITSLGLGSSAVRSIASAAADPDSPRITETIVALRRICWITGLLGMAICAVFSARISQWTFGSEDHATSLALLSVTILISQFSTGQTALLRGLRKIRELAAGSIVTSMVSVVLSVALIGTLGIEGIVPFVLCGALVSLAVTWQYARKVKVADQRPTWPESMVHGREMLALGLTFLASTGLSSAAAYLIGVALFDAGSAELNGHYQAAWGCSGALVSFVLASMGQDFYPRLTVVAHDNDASGKLINSQAEVGILLALPCLVAMAGLTPVLMPILYSKDFSAAQGALPWFLLGSFGRVVSWPLGYYLVAAGHKRWLLLTELATNVLHVGGVYILANRYGVYGAGAAFLAVYVFYTALIYAVVRRLSGFSASRGAVLYAVLGSAVILAASFAGVVAGSVIAILTLYLCLRTLARKSGREFPTSSLIARLPLVGRLFGKPKS